jgi:hypothetical protein
MAGDTLLAHELAHVAQQAGGGGGSAAGSDALERDADASADSVVGRLWNGVKRFWSTGRNEQPQLKSGLRLQRQAASYRHQQASSFQECHYCICERASDIPEMVGLMVRQNGVCPPGFTIDWVDGSCGGKKPGTKTALTSNPCPASPASCMGPPSHI